jgi:hypothetical protein
LLQARRAAATELERIQTSRESGYDEDLRRARLGA